MRSFFVQIFLAFWISILLTFIFSAALFPNPAFPSPETSRNALAGMLRRVAASEEHDRTTCQPQSNVLVFDASGREICGGELPDGVAPVITEARRTSHSSYALTSRYWAMATPAGANTALLVMPAPERHWFPHMPPSTIPISVGVTFVFAYLLTNPVRALRAAFRRFSSGDMTVRLPVSRSPLRDWGGADVRTLMIDFNDMADRIQELLAAQKRLLRDVSHELRSPLARLNVALELAREDSASDAALDRAELESARLNALIGELLSLSSMESSQTVPNQAPVSLEDIIENLMPDLTFEADARGCRLSYIRRTVCPVVGNEDLLRRAIENVIRNAVRYSPTDSQVTIETSTSERTCVVRICDSGPGVPESSLEAIFQPFYRVDSARQSSTGGFGVGLAIAERAVRLHGGNIRAFNLERGGLCVELSFPCAN